MERRGKDGKPGKTVESEKAGVAKRTGRPRTGAVVLAGGQGKRMKSAVQKQYLILDGRPLIAHALLAFEASPVDAVVLVVGAGEIPYVKKEILAPLGLSKVTAVVEGGRERVHSVYEGLKALTDCDYVLIHDGARPLVSGEIIRRAMEGAVRYGACVAAMPVKDTIRVADGEGFSAETPDRSRLWQIQTPQAFSYEVIRSAYDRVMADESLLTGITDDAMVVERQGGPAVKLVEGSYENLKVTTPEDLILAEALLNFRKKGGKGRE